MGLNKQKHNKKHANRQKPGLVAF